MTGQRLVRLVIVLLLLVGAVPLPRASAHTTAGDVFDHLHAARQPSSAPAVQRSAVQRLVHQPLATVGTHVVQRLAPMLPILASASFDTPAIDRVTASTNLTEHQSALDRGGSLYLPLVLRDSGTAPVITAQGGQLASVDGRIVLSIPAGAVSEPTRFSLTLDATHPAITEYQSLDAFFTLTATTLDGQTVTHFAQPLTLQVQYTSGSGGTAAQRGIFFFDETAQVWQPLASTDDTDAGLLTATTDHFTHFAALMVGGAEVRLTSIYGTSSGPVIAVYPSGIPLDDLRLYLTNIATGATEFVIPNADDGLFHSTAMGGLGTRLQFHVADINGTILPFTTYGNLGAYGYRVRNTEGVQPLFVGQGAASWEEFDAFLAAYTEVGGTDIVGTADSGLVHDWGGYPTQGFTGGNGHSGSVIIYNTGRCKAFQVKGDILGKYINLGGSASWLGPPISHEITAPAEFYQSTGEPISFFKHGVITRKQGEGAFTEGRYYPRIGNVFVSFNPSTNNELQGAIQFTTVPVPGLPNEQGDFIIVGSSNISNVTLIANNTYTAQLGSANGPIHQGDDVVFSLKIKPRTSNDPYGTTGDITVPNAAPGLAGLYADLPPDPSIDNCTGGGYEPPVDTTPPVITDVTVFGDNTGNVAVAATVTDDRAVAEVVAEIDNTPHVMPRMNGDTYGVIVDEMTLGVHQLRITATDTAGLQSYWPSSTTYHNFEITLSGFHGKLDSQAFSPDPVNTQIGNYIYDYTDLNLVEAGPDFVLNRFYNAQNDEVGLFGMGWTTVLDMHVVKLDNPLITGAQVRYADGRTVNFPAQGSGYGHARTVFDTLAPDGAGYLLTRTDQTQYHFNAAGALISVNDLSGNTLTLTYSGANLVRVTTPSGRVVTFTSNTAGQITQIQAPDGVRISYGYDADGRLISVTDGTGATVTYEYDPDHGMTALQTPEGHTFLTEQQYDDRGRVIFQRVGDNFINRFTYDDANRTTKLEDTYGNTITYRYDDQGRLIEQIDALGHSEKFTFNFNHQRTSYTDRNGNTTTYEYNANGDLIKTTDPQNNATVNTYDSQHHLLTTTDALGRITRYEYDAQGRRTALIDALGQRTEMDYDSQGRMIEQISPRGFSTTYTYDARSNLIEMQDALGGITRYTYDVQGRRTKMIDPRGNATAYTYDANGNLVTETDALGHTIRYVYDDNNNRVSETDKNGNTTTYTYNQLDNLVSTTTPDGSVATIGYDDLNHRIAETDALGFSTHRELDGLYRIVNEIDALGNTTTYEYDAQGNRISVTNARSWKTHYEYDSLNRVVKIIDPLGGTTTYVYDKVGNRISETNARGATTLYRYDALNRVDQQIDALGHTTTTAYDADGNRSSQTDAVGNVTTWTYDALNRVSSETNALGFTKTYAYDAAGNQITATDALGGVTSSSYDAVNQLVQQIDALGNVTRYEYDPNGNQTAVIDAYYFRTRMVYDVMNRRTATINAFGQREDSRYDRNGRRISTTDANGNTTTFNYDALGRTLKTIDPLGYSVQSDYDEVGNEIKEIDQNGAVTRTRYDALDRIVWQANPLNYVTRFSYDAVGNLIAKTDALGFITTYGYDLLNRRVRETNALGFTTQSVYDALGRMTSTIFADGTTVSTTFDALGQATARTDGEGYTTTMAYDALGRATTTTDALGSVTTVEYDALGRQISVSDALGVMKQLAYDKVGNVISQTDGNGNATRFIYDALHRQTSITDPTGDTTRFRYDAVGNRIAVIDGNNNVSTATYDARNQLVAETNALEQTTQYKYDGVGQRTQTIDALGIVTLAQYDLAGQLVAVTENYQPNQLATVDVNVRTRYTYDAVGNRTSIIDPNGRTVTFVPDAVGQLVNETDPVGNLTRYSYDSVGRQIERTDPDGQIVQSVYDQNGRLISTIYPDGSSVVRTYDANNNLLTVENGSDLIVRTYDSRKQLLSETTTQGTVAATYDGAGNRLSLHYPDGSLLSYEYDLDNTLLKVINPRGETTTYERDGVDQVTKQRNGNQTVTTSQYDAANHLVQTQTRRTSDNSVVASVSYDYNTIDQRVKATFEYRTGTPRTVTETYTQDALRRLTGQTISNGVVTTYAYDAAGNRTQWTTTDDPRTTAANDALDLEYTYSLANELLRVENVATGAWTDYRYDVNGNRIEEQQGNAGRAYEYDAEHRLVGVEAFVIDEGGRTDLPLASMIYDGDGRRSAKAEVFADDNGVLTTHYAFAGLDPIATTTTWQPITPPASNVGILTYDPLDPHSDNLYRAEGGSILTMDRTVDTNIASHWFTQDGLGSTLALATYTGQTEQNYRYDPYGLIKPTTPVLTPANAWTYTGQEYDETLGLYHFHARTYDPNTGTWLTRDPYRGTYDDPQSLHRYAYVKGNPINLVDVYGYAACGTFGKCQHQLPHTSFLDYLFTLVKVGTNIELRYILDKLSQTDFSLEVNPREVFAALKSVQRETLFHHDLTPDSLRNVNVLGKQFSLYAGYELELSIGIDTPLDQIKIDLEDLSVDTKVAVCIKAHARGEAGVTIPFSAIISADIYGTMGVEGEGCIGYSTKHGWNIDGELKAYGGIGGRLYALVDVFFAAARVGGRVETRFEGTISSNSEESGLKLHIEAAPFLGYKYWPKNWEDTDLFVISEDIPLFDK